MTLVCVVHLHKTVHANITFKCKPIQTVTVRGSILSELFIQKKNFNDATLPSLGTDITHAKQIQINITPPTLPNPILISVRKVSLHEPGHENRYPNICNWGDVPSHDAANMHVNLCQGCKYENVTCLALQAKVMQNMHERLNVEKQLHR